MGMSFVVIETSSIKEGYGSDEAKILDSFDNRTDAENLVDTENSDNRYIISVSDTYGTREQMIRTYRLQEITLAVMDKFCDMYVAGQLHPDKTDFPYKSELYERLIDIAETIEGLHWLYEGPNEPEFTLEHIERWAELQLDKKFGQGNSDTVRNLINAVCDYDSETNEDERETIHTLTNMGVTIEEIYREKSDCGVLLDFIKDSI